MNLGDAEIAELERNPEESEQLVKQLIREYKTYSDLMGKKSRLLVMEKNYEYLAFRALYEIQNNIKSAKLMIPLIESPENVMVRRSMEIIKRMEQAYGNEKPEFHS